MQRFVDIFGDTGNFLLSNVETIKDIAIVLTGLVAAFASLWSARAAAHSVKHAREVERRGLIRDIVVVAYSIIAETQRVEDLGAKLAQGYQTRFIFSGRSESSCPQAYQNEVENGKEEVIPLRKEAEKYVSGPRSLQMLKHEKLVDILTELTRCLMRAQSIKEKFDRSLKDIEGQNAVFRGRGHQ